jgi:hypothetical protein
MSDAFLSITEATQYTGKSRRTLLRLATRLAKDHPEQVMRERTSRGYIWRIREQSLQQMLGVTRSGAVSPANPDPERPLRHALTAQQEKYLEVTQQGYTGILAMHQEVKQVYEVRLAEKEQRIAELAEALTQARRGWWTRLLGH